MSSTAISHLAYDAASRALLVIFTSGRRYVYANVEPELFTAFSHAPSRGAFFNREVRDRYAYREVTPGSGADRQRRRA
jgi:hypothetical protein